MGGEIKMQMHDEKCLKVKKKEWTGVMNPEM